MRRLLRRGRDRHFKAGRTGGLSTTASSRMGVEGGGSMVLMEPAFRKAQLGLQLVLEGEARKGIPQDPKWAPSSKVDRQMGAEGRATVRLTEQR
jgi:hypothetical protein